jgi:putative oxidoreductase
MLKKIFAPGNNSGAANFGLLVLRLWIGFSMLLNHGVEKLEKFSDTAPNFPDPLGIGHTASLALVVFAEFFVSLFVIFGLVTRWGRGVVDWRYLLSFNEISDLR